MPEIQFNFEDHDQIELRQQRDDQDDYQYG